MVSEDKAKELIRNLVYRACDSLGYGEKVSHFGGVSYNVNGKRMTLAEYQEYCFKKEIKKFGIK